MKNKILNISVFSISILLIIIISIYIGFGTLGTFYKLTKKDYLNNNKYITVNQFHLVKEPCNIIDNDFKIIDYLEKNNVVYVISDNGLYVNIKYKDNIGYINKKYIGLKVNYENTIINPIKIENRYNKTLYTKLDFKYLKCYNIFIDELKSNADIDIYTMDYPFKTIDEIKNFIYKVNNSYDFYYSYGLSYKVLKSNKNYYLSLNFPETKKNFYENKEMIKRLNYIVFNYIPLDKDDIEITYSINDFIVNHISYNINIIDSYDGLFFGQTRCSGYSRIFEYLMNISGIKTDTVVGKADGVGHAWNKYKIDNTTYYGDVTYNANNKNNYYLFLEENEIMENRVIYNKERCQTFK